MQKYPIVTGILVVIGSAGTISSIILKMKYSIIIKCPTLVWGRME